MTGAVGRVVGAALRALFGSGAAFVPAIPLFWAIALFGHFERVTSRRATILLAGLALAVPFSLGVTYQYSDSVVRAGIEAGNPYDPPAWVGIIGGMFAYYLRGFGPVGEGLIGLGAFSALTISTVGWNPFSALRRKEKVEQDEARDARRERAEGLSDEPVAEVLEPEPHSRLAPLASSSDLPPTDSGPPPRPKKKEPKPSMAKIIGSIVPRFGGAKSGEAEALPPIE
ncbi:MAG: hypothetical protein ACHQX4_06225, partial [Gemmatimonadales bacterium]